MNRRNFLFSAVVAAAALGLASCAENEPLPGPTPQIGFAHLDKIFFRAARIDVRSTYKSPLMWPHAEHRMPTSPERALFDWGLTRLSAAGGEGDTAVGELVIEDARVIEVKLPKTEGLKGTFTYEPTERYDARATARFEIKDPARGASGQVRVTAERSIEVSENATLAQREQAWLELVEKLMADFNGKMEEEIRTHLSVWVMR